MVKNPTASAGDAGPIPGSGRSPGGGRGSPLLYSCLEHPMDRGARQAAVHVVTESQIPLSDFHCKCYDLSQVEVFLVAQMVKILPVIQETWVSSLGWEDTL